MGLWSRSRASNFEFLQEAPVSASRVATADGDAPPHADPDPAICVVTSKNHAPLKLRTKKASSTSCWSCFGGPSPEAAPSPQDAGGYEVLTFNGVYDAVAGADVHLSPSAHKSFVSSLSTPHSCIKAGWVTPPAGSFVSAACSQQCVCPAGCDDDETSRHRAAEGMLAVCVCGAATPLPSPRCHDVVVADSSSVGRDTVRQQRRQQQEQCWRSVHNLTSPAWDAAGAATAVGTGIADAKPPAWRRAPQACVPIQKGRFTNGHRPPPLTKQEAQCASAFAMSCVGSGSYFAEIYATDASD